MTYLMICFIIAFIIDYTPAIDKLSKLVYQKLTGTHWNGDRLPLIGCSLCSTFWTILTYSLIISNGVVLSLFLASICAYFVSILSPILYKVKSIIQKIFKL